MPAIKQSVCFNPFNQDDVTPAELIAAAARIGYKSVEMAAEEHWPLIKDSGLDIAIVVGHDSLPDGLNKRENHDRIEDELLANIDLAVANDIPALICFSGNREGKSEEEGLANCVEGLRRVTAAAEEQGITLCMELLNSRVNHPDYQCDRTAWGAAMCRAVGSPRVKLLHDIYHMQIMEGDLIRNITDYIDCIGHFHTAGNPGRQDLDDEQEIYYPPIMKAIAASDYQGYVGHEYRPKAGTIASLEHAFGICDV
tara:strand:+ start:422 stop:1183 length:762 start_codon:yes stop_codon:yes gene_type:complete